MGPLTIILLILLVVALLAAILPQGNVQAALVLTIVAVAILAFATG